MNSIKCLMKENTMYQLNREIEPVYGIVVHSTGANNTNLSRYVQPSKSDPKYDELIKIIGKNAYGNSWNGPVGKGVHYMIGKLADGTPAVVQCLDLDIAAGGVGYGSKGSFNYAPTACFQFEILEDGLTDKSYFDKVFGLAIELCADLCEEHNLPVEKIFSHKECAALGYGTAHGDPENWLTKFGLTMDWFRAEVQKKLDGRKPQPEEWKTIFESDKIRIQTK